jgi:hypothetical protein
VEGTGHKSSEEACWQTRSISRLGYGAKKTNTLLTNLLRECIGSASVNTFPQLRNSKRKRYFLHAEPSRALPCRASLVPTQRCNKHNSAAASQHATVQNTLLFRVSYQGFIGETEVSSQSFLSEFLAGDSRKNLIV